MQMFMLYHNLSIKVWWKVKGTIFNTDKFTYHDEKKFILLLHKGVYLYEYMDDWEKLNDTSLPETENFYSHLNTKGFTDADYAHAKRVRKDFEIKRIGEYHDLYVQSDTLLLADVFENFWSMSLEIYELNPAHFLTASGLAFQASLKNTKVKLGLLTYINMLLNIGKVLEREYVTLFIDMQKLITNAWKIMIIKKESSCLKYWDVNNL